MTSTFEWLRDTLVADYKIDAELITPETVLEEIGLDSLAVAELLFNVEDAFRITLTAEPVHLVRLADVVTYIDDLVALQHRAPSDEVASDGPTRSP